MLEIPWVDLSDEALTGLIDEYVTRESNVFDGSLLEKRERIMKALKKRNAVITFDPESGSTHLLTRQEFENAKRTQ